MFFSRLRIALRAGCAGRETRPLRWVRIGRADCPRYKGCRRGNRGTGDPSPTGDRAANDRPYGFSFTYRLLHFTSYFLPLTSYFSPVILSAT